MSKRIHIEDWTPTALNRALRGALRPSDGEEMIRRARYDAEGEGECSDCLRFLTFPEDPRYGVCLNPLSPRWGLLSEEYQGCREWMGE